MDETTAYLAVSPSPTLFEAAFVHDGVLVRADVLRPVRGGHEIVEVKASTCVHDYQLDDCAIQAWVIEQAGTPLKRIRLAHVDSSFVYAGGGNYRGLLRVENVSAEVRRRMPDVPRWARRLKRMLRGDEPAVATGRHCTQPSPCPFFDHCRAGEPAGPKYPLTILPHAGKLIEELQSDGLVDLRKVPAARLEKPLHRRIRSASISGRAFLDPQAAVELAGIGYPRHYLDFETIAFAVPRWAGTHPYQQVPFQWSCHVEQRGGSLRHRMFLDLSGEPPMRAFAESLLVVLGRRGPILVYNQGFEASRVKELAELLPDLSAGLLALVERMVDLLPITRAHYYHPAMMGSWSIKAVLPTIAPELDYARLEDVADGNQAQLAWLEATHPQTTARRRKELDRALRRYCANDTLALVRLTAALTGAA